MTKIKSKVNVLSSHVKQKLQVSSFRNSDLDYPSYKRGCTASPAKSDNFQNCGLLQAVMRSEVCDTHLPHGIKWEDTSDIKLLVSSVEQAFRAKL